jgi:hypothetical protein
MVVREYHKPFSAFALEQGRGRHVYGPGSSGSCSSFHKHGDAKQHQRDGHGGCKADVGRTLRNEHADEVWNRPQYPIDFSEHAGEWLQTRAVGSYCILDQTQSRHEVMVDCVYFKQFGRTHEYLNFKGL